MMKSILFKIALPISFCFLLITSCRKNNDAVTLSLVAEYNNQVVYEWNELFMAIDKDAKGYRPGPGPRALAYMGLSAYEICVPGMPSYASMARLWGSELVMPVFDSGKRVHYPTALNTSYAYLMHQFFKNTVFVGGVGHLTNQQVHQMIDNLQLKIDSKYEIEINPIEFNQAKKWGAAVSDAIWNWAQSDSYGHEAELNPLNNDPSKANYYDWKKELLDPNGKVKPGTWSPTNDNGNGGMFPFWGRVRTFASNENQKLCRAPIPYSKDVNSPYYAEALLVYNTCNSNMNFENKWIAEFWSDDIVGLTFSPPTRMLAIFNQILGAERSNLEKAVEGVAKLGLALNDFGVCCWNSKWHYKVERPENFIKREIDPNWEPILVNPLDGTKGVTPAFPAYPSGHSTFGGGGAVILENIFSPNYEFTDNCHANRSDILGTPRHFSSFAAAGDENALSRVYLGVHFRMDCDAGVELGRAIANRVIRLPWKK